MDSVSKKLGWKDRWYAVEHIDKSGGLLVGWTEEVKVHQIISSSFSIELEFETVKTGGKMWAIFIHASNKDRIQGEQWQELWAKKDQWGPKWILGVDFNDIRKPQEKQGGKLRTEASCKGFTDFIEQMHMEEVEVQGQQWTWANNWRDEGYIEARLDRFFGAAQRLLEHDQAKVKHIMKQASDHCLLLLDTKPTATRKKGRFHFDKRWLAKPGLEDTIQQAWEADCFGSPMHQVVCKIKQCRLAILEGNRLSKQNSAIRIQELKTEMEQLQSEGGARDWGR